MKSSEQVKKEAGAMLASKRRELGTSKDDREFYLHHLKKLEKIERNKEAVGIEDYNFGNEFLPKLLENIANRATKNFPLHGINPANFNFSDLTKMHISGISQRDVNEMNNRYKLKDKLDMEDLMNLSTKELNALKELVIQQRRESVMSPNEHPEFKKFLVVLNKVIRKHNLEHEESQAIEPIEILIDLNKTKDNAPQKATDKLPPIQVKQEEYQSIEITPSSSRSTIVHSYSERSFNRVAKIMGACPRDG